MQSTTYPKTASRHLSGSIASVALACSIAMVALGPNLHADIVLDWSEALYQFNAPFGLAGAPPTGESRAYAMIHIAMYQAVNEANRTRSPHAASPEAAAAQAAHDVTASVLNTSSF